MRDRYVWQVLAVTLGFSVLLGVIAVLDAPPDWSQTPVAVPSASGNPSSGSTPTQVKPGYGPAYGMSPRVVDFDDRSDSPLRDPDGDAQPLPWQNCSHADPAHKKACEDTGQPGKAGKIHHC